MKVDTYCRKFLESDVRTSYGQYNSSRLSAVVLASVTLRGLMNQMEFELGFEWV